MRAHSAGSAPSGRIHPHAIEVLCRADIDTGACRGKSWNEFGRPCAPKLSVVLTVCDSAAAETCPVFVSADGGPGAEPLRVHWGTPDPSRAEGGDEHRLRAFELTARPSATACCSCWPCRWTR